MLPLEQLQTITQPITQLFRNIAQLGSSLLQKITPFLGQTSGKVPAHQQSMPSFSQSNVSLTRVEPISNQINRLWDEHADLTMRLSQQEATTQALLESTDQSSHTLSALEKSLDSSLELKASQTLAEKKLNTVLKTLELQNPQPTKPATPKQLDFTLDQPSFAGAEQPRPSANTAHLQEQHSLHFSSLPATTTPSKLRQFLNSKGYENHNVSGAHLDCGLRTTLICLASHFSKLPRSQKQAAIHHLTAHFKPEHANQAKVMRDFVSLGKNGIQSIHHAGSLHLEHGPVSESQLKFALGTLATDLASQGKLSHTSQNDIVHTINSASHMLGNDGISELLQTLKIPANLITFGTAQVQLESMKSDDQLNPVSDSSAPLKGLNDSKPCIYLAGGHYQILVPK